MNNFIDHMIFVFFIGAALAAVGAVIVFIADLPKIQKFGSKLVELLYEENEE